MNSNAKRSMAYVSEDRTIYVGKLQRLISQSKAPSMLMVSIDGDLQLIDGKNQQDQASKSLLIPAGMRTTINTNDSTIIFFFLGVLGGDLATLKNRMGNSITIDDKTCFYTDLRDEDRIITSALDLLNTQPSAESAFMELDEWIGPMAPGTETPADERVTAAVDLIRASAVENISVDDIAQRLKLSEPRLYQLFKDITGIPIRRYRIWMRVYTAIAKIAEGLSITDAALASGFSDSAHFSRIFKEIGGVKPTDVLSSKNDMAIRVLAPPLRALQV